MNPSEECNVKKLLHKQPESTHQQELCLLQSNAHGSVVGAIIASDIGFQVGCESFEMLQAQRRCWSTNQLTGHDRVDSKDEFARAGAQIRLQGYPTGQEDPRKMEVPILFIFLAHFH